MTHPPDLDNIYLRFRVDAESENLGGYWDRVHVYCNGKEMDVGRPKGRLLRVELCVSRPFPPKKKKIC